jgi:hypothetical protein
MIIYKTTNLINNKIYIGKDRYNNPAYMGSGRNLKLAVKKYGKENFVKEILEHCTSKQHMNEREIYWISYYNSREHEIGYNIAPGSGGYSLDSLIDKYGLEEAIKRNNESNKKKGRKLEDYIRKYGIELGNQKWKERYAIVSKANKKPKKERSKNTLEGYIHRYGEIEGPVRYNDWCELQSQKSKGRRGWKGTRENFIIKYGLEEGIKRYEDKNIKTALTMKKNGFHSDLQGFITKYGEEVGTMKYNEYCKKNSNAQKNKIKRIYKILNPFGETIELLSSKTFEEYCKSNEIGMTALRYNKDGIKNFRLLEIINV